MEEGFGVADLDEQLLKACKTLASHGIEYHFLDETLLEKCGFVTGIRKSEWKRCRKAVF